MFFYVKYVLYRYFKESPWVVVSEIEMYLTERKLSRKYILYFKEVNNHFLRRNRFVVSEYITTITLTKQFSGFSLR